MNRTRIRRRTPFQPGSPPERKTGLARQPWSPAVPILSGDSGPAGATGAPGRETGFSRKVKLQVRTRAGNGDAAEALCEACGAA